MAYLPVSTDKGNEPLRNLDIISLFSQYSYDCHMKQNYAYAFYLVSIINVFFFLFLSLYN